MKKEQAHRVIPELWYPDKENNESRADALVRKIFEKLQNGKHSKFIIFVRYKTEANDLKSILTKKFKDFNKDLSVETIFAENKEN